MLIFFCLQFLADINSLQLTCEKRLVSCNMVSCIDVQLPHLEHTSPTIPVLLTITCGWNTNTRYFRALRSMMCPLQAVFVRTFEQVVTIHVTVVARVAVA
jgi:hypothetical protein